MQVGAGEEAGRLAAADDQQRQPGFGGDAVEGGVEVGQHLARDHVVRLAGHVDLEEGAAVGVLLDGDGFGLEERHERSLGLDWLRNQADAGRTTVPGSYGTFPIPILYVA